MAVGKGKYDDVCTLVRKLTSADGTLLIIFNGDDGTGFASQLPLDALLTMPDLLRRMADDIAADNTEVVAGIAATSDEVH